MAKTRNSVPSRKRTKVRSSSGKKVKRLYRASEKDSMVGGVCAGIADYFGVDPTLVRIITVALAFASGTGILAYLIAWIIIPRK